MQVAFKRHRNIREFLCRAKLYDQQDRRNPTRGAQLGWRRCHKCTTCKYSENQTAFKISATKETVSINQRLDCKTRNVIYVVTCLKCPDHPQYIGKTKRSLMVRGREHLQNIERLKLGTFNKPASKMYNHFISKGHHSRDFHIHAIEEVFGDDFVAMTREHHWINRADTVRRGLNTYKT